MPFGNCGELKQALQDFMDRTDIAGNADDFVTLAEAGLNRELNALEVDTNITSVTNSDIINLSGKGIETPLELYMSEYGREWSLLKLEPGSFPKIDAAGRPAVWATSNDTVYFDRPVDGNYQYRLHHTVKFDLVADEDTNWLLENHPDVYLSACIVWGATFVADDATRQRYGAPLQAFIQSVNQDQRKKRKGTLVMDPALSSISRRNGWWGIYPR